MNTPTPTPKTDEAANEGKAKLYQASQQLETELIAAREEIENLKFICKCESESSIEAHDILKAVTEQRDRLAEALRGVLRGTGCCQSDKPESHPLAKYKNALIALQSLKEH